MTSMISPKWYQPGQTIGLAAPASPFGRRYFENSLKVLGEMHPGLRLRADGSIFAADGWLAGSDDLRARHLMRLFGAEDVGLVWAYRGGFGSSRVLPLLDLETMAASGRCLMGFSDITCLLAALARHGLIGLHGPTLNQLPHLDLISREDVRSIIKGAPGWPHVLRGRTVTPGKAQGPLLGGNLSLVCHLMGTPWSIPFDGAILFLEDTNEQPYRLDRLLTQLELAGVPGRIKGLALGLFGAHGYVNPERDRAVEQRVREWGVPLVCGLPFGHGPRNRVLPVGAAARIEEPGILKVGLDLA